MGSRVLKNYIAWECDIFIHADEIFPSSVLPLQLAFLFSLSLGLLDTSSAVDMRSVPTFVGLLGLLTSYVSATALTYKLAPNERECFYTNVEKKDAKIAFYFAVQSGGSFDSVYTYCSILWIGRRVRC